jgi:hypothetical protein
VGAVAHDPATVNQNLAAARILWRSPVLYALDFG